MSKDNFERGNWYTYGDILFRFKKLNGKQLKAFTKINGDTELSRGEYPIYMIDSLSSIKEATAAQCVKGVGIEERMNNFWSEEKQNFKANLICGEIYKSDTCCFRFKEKTSDGYIHTFDSINLTSGLFINSNALGDNWTEEQLNIEYTSFPEQMQLMQKEAEKDLIFCKGKKDFLNLEDVYYSTSSVDEATELCLIRPDLPIGISCVNHSFIVSLSSKTIDIDNSAQVFKDTFITFLNRY